MTKRKTGRAILFWPWVYLNIPMRQQNNINLQYKITKLQKN